MKNLAVGVLLVVLALGAGCKKKATPKDWSDWFEHYEALAAEAKKKVDACNPKDRSAFDDLLASHHTTLRETLKYVERDDAPKPETVACFMQATTCDAVTACPEPTASADTTLDSMLRQARANCQLATNTCRK